MKKTIIAAALLAASLNLSAGGIVTNTNQSVSFLRMPAQNAVISVDGAYFNPAGIGFLSNGLHLGGTWMIAWQTRQSTTDFAPFAYGANNNGSTSIKYKGKTFVPVIPSMDIAYVHDKFFVSSHIGITGGGGRVKYNQGLGSFESSIAAAAASLNSLGLPTLYSADMNLEGASYQFSGQVNFGYRLNEHLNISAGLRYTQAYNAYDAYIKNITLTTNGFPTAAVLNSMGMTTQAQTLTAMTADRNLDCKMAGGAFSPILGVDYKAGKINLAARYEFRAAITLKNNTDVNTSGLIQFDDKKKTSADAPALLSVGASYVLLPNVRLYTGTNYYFDKESKTYNPETDANDRQDNLEGNSWELLGGIEWDLNEKFTFSTGIQSTNYNFGKDVKYITDMNNVTSSTSMGIGGVVNISEKTAFEFGWLTTIYSKLPKEYSISGIQAKDEFFRTSNAVAVGFKLKF